jgi:hypothetical protein
MKLSRKVTDFIRLEEGNIGRKAAIVTGALLTSSVLGAVLISTVEAVHCDMHMDDQWHSNYAPHTNHYNGHSNHSDHSNSHLNGDYPECPE